MHVISYKCLREFGKKHSDCRGVLDDWFKVAIRTNWSNLIEFQSVFPKTEAVGKFTVFNIKGNRYRLIVSIDYEGQLIYIKYVLTHADYDKEQWKHDSYF
jgi:mRNA interferase HigB